jgi:hypothetical protein
VQKFIVDLDVTLPVDPESKKLNIAQIPIIGLPNTRFEFIPVNDNLDSSSKRDFIAIADVGSQQKISWVQFVQNSYKATPMVTLPTSDADKKSSRGVQLSARIDLDNDGKSELVLAYLQDGDEDSASSPMHFIIYDQQMKLLKSWTYDSVKAQIPYRVYWHKFNGRKWPSWVGPGKDPDRKRNLQDRWSNPKNIEKNEIRFYYFKDEKTLSALSEYQGYKIVDILEPRQEEVAQGQLTVLLAKNLGSENKPSYLSQFATAKVIDGQIKDFKEMAASAQKGDYRNLLDTKYDPVYNLDRSNNIYAGTFWFGEGLSRQQRLSIRAHSGQWLDQPLRASLVQFDSTLWVRAAFWGTHRKGAFAMTNSEIQYHDLENGSVALRSLERYTFYADYAFTNLQYPMVVEDSQSDQKLPALFTTEGSRLNRGVRITVPVYGKDGRVLELVAPAALRFQSVQGCRPLETPAYEPLQGKTSLDYFCRDKILRVNLKF